MKIKKIDMKVSFYTLYCVLWLDLLWLFPQCDWILANQISDNTENENVSP